MSKATENFKKFIESDRGERKIYREVGESLANREAEKQVRMPLTRDGFEAIVEEACKFLGVEVTGPVRNVAVGFFHSLGRTTYQTSITDLAGAIHNSLSNHMTYQIDQEIKAAANAELREEQEKLRAAQEELAKKAAIEKRQAKLAKKGKTSGETANEAST